MYKMIYAFQTNKMNPNKLDKPPKKLFPPAFAEKAGKIQEIIQDPEVESRRIKSVKEWTRTGLQNLKHGRYARLPLLFPNKDYAIGAGHADIKELYQRIYESVRNFDIKDKDQISEMIGDLVRIDLIRAMKNVIYETVDGGVQDKNLTTLLNNISQRMIVLLEIRKPAISVSNLILQSTEEIRNKFDENTRVKLIEAIEADLEGLPKSFC